VVAAEAATVTAMTVATAAVTTAEAVRTTVSPSKVFSRLFSKGPGGNSRAFFALLR
jgi:hypothetical protein